MSDLSLDDPLTRFIFQRNHIRWGNLTPKHNAFMPRNGNLSAFRIGTITESEIWEIGKDIEIKREQELYGRADILTKIVLDNNLGIDIDDSPKYHVNILGWPTDDDKDRIKDIAMELASKAELKLLP